MTGKGRSLSIAVMTPNYELSHARLFGRRLQRKLAADSMIPAFSVKGAISTLKMHV